MHPSDLNSASPHAPQRSSDTAVLTVTVAAIACAAAWGVLLSGVNSELSGVTDHSFRWSYVIAGVVAVLGIAAAAISGFIGRGGVRTLAAVTFWLLLGPTLWGGLTILAMVDA